MTLGWGGKITVGQCAKIVRAALAHPVARFPRSFCGWAPAGSREILREFRDGVHDRINGHLPAVREWSDDKIERVAYCRGLRSECRWCGRTLPLYERDKQSCRNFCAGGDCRRLPPLVLLVKARASSLHRHGNRAFPPEIS